MAMNRREFLGALGLAAGSCALSSCSSARCCAAGVKSGVAVQLYSIGSYIGGNEKKGVKGRGFDKALEDVARIGYKGVEFAGYWQYDNDAAGLRKVLDANGLVACGTHISRKSLYPENIGKTCEFNLALGNNNIICPGGGNTPPGKGPTDDFPKFGYEFSWNKPSTGADDWWKYLTEFYAKAADAAATYKCNVGIHNHMWEFFAKMADGKSFWEYFFANTPKNVCMEQDVGWTTCAGEDPCKWFRMFPGRSPTLHAKENGMGPGVKKFDAILGQPGCDENGKACAKGVDWDSLAVAADADGVKWWVVECEKHFDSLDAITASFEFLRSKGRC